MTTEQLEWCADCKLHAALYRAEDGRLLCNLCGRKESAFLLPETVRQEEADEALHKQENSPNRQFGLRGKYVSDPYLSQEAQGDRR